MPKNINYTLGSGIEVPSNITYSYDAVGNRTSMQDELGTTTYAYNSLSRLTSETRAFNDTVTGFNQSYTFNYTYDLAGQLTEFSDPADLTRKVSYARDKIGRVTSVGGNGFGNVTSYASNLQYRAFGAVKSLNYGSGKTLSQTFNNRLQLEQFNVSGGATTQDNLGSTNRYYADGRIKSAGSVSGNTYSDTFDRLYKYDHAGRIAEAKSGLEARDETQTSYDRPYRQTYGYNAFSNLTNRTGEVWDTTAEPFAAAYTNNRNDSQYWTYDADGRNTFDENVNSYFDASGRRYKTSGNPTIEQTFDGDGQRIKQTENAPSKKRYYVNSSILGTIYEIEQSGTSWVKKVGMVYLNGQQLAMQNANQTVWWFYENPATGSTRGTSTKMASEPDPLGVNNRTSAPIEPPDYDNGVPDFVLPSRIVDPSNMSGGCQWGGLRISCDQASDLADLENHATGGFGSGVTSGNPWGLNNMQQTTANTAGTALATSHLGMSSLDPRSGLGGSLNNQATIWNQGTGWEEYVMTTNPETGETYPVPTAYAGGGYFVDGDDKEIKKLPKSLFDVKKGKHSDIDGLRKDFNSRLAIGDCLNKLNALLGELGSKFTSIEELGNKFLNSENNLLQTIEPVENVREKNSKGKWESVGAPTGVTSSNGKQIVLNSRNNSKADGFTFMHELIHAAGAGKGGSYSHDKIANAIAKLENTPRGSRGSSNFMNDFIGKYCK